MERMERLEDISMKLYHLLDQPMLGIDREKMIKDAQELLAERELILQEVKAPYTEEENEIGQRLIPIDKKIEQKLNHLFTNLKVEMRSVKRQKSSNQKYTNPYKNASNFDGTFLDKKK